MHCTRKSNIPVLSLVSDVIGKTSHVQSKAPYRTSRKELYKRMEILWWWIHMCLTFNLIKICEYVICILYNNNIYLNI